MANRNKPIPGTPAMQWVMIAVFIALVVVAGIIILSNGRNVSPLQVQICWAAVAGLFTLILFAGSKASAEGKICGIKFSTKGQFAAFIIFYVILFTFAPNFGMQSVRLYLEQEGKPLNVAFQATIYIAGAETIPKSGEHGDLLFQMPGNLDTIKNVDVVSAGYEAVSKGPYQITDGAITIQMRRSRQPEPPPPTDFPSEQSIFDMPTEQNVVQPPRVNPTDVTFQYKNLTKFDLQLVFLSCTAYYEWRKTGDGNRRPVGIWLDWGFPARDEFTSFDNFSEKSSGWYCFFVARVDRATGNRKYTYLGARNLFESKTPVLIVRDSADPSEAFKAEFRTSE